MRRLIAILGFLYLLSAGNIYAQPSVFAYNGICESGNVSVTIPGTQGSGNQKFQQSFPSCTVTVYNTGTLTPAVIFADVNSTPKANPFAAQTSGRFTFYVAPGIYDIQLSGAGLSAPFTLPAVNIASGGGTTPPTTAKSCIGAGDLSTKIRTAYQLAPVGGFINCSNLNGAGAQTISFDPFGTMTAPTTVLLPVGTISVSTSMTTFGNVTVQFPQGSILKPTASTNILTFNGYISAGTSQIFDITSSGVASIFIIGNRDSYVQWFGAIGNGLNDDTNAIQSAINSCRGAKGAAGYSATCRIVLLSAFYKTTAQLNMFASDGGYNGLWMTGTSKFLTNIGYQGPTSSSAIKMIGQLQKITDLHIVDNGSGWLDGIQYDGDVAIGISTVGNIDDITVECQGRSGNAISAGRSAHQADQFVAKHVFLTGCNLGYGFVSYDPNAVDYVFIGPLVSFCWVGFGIGPTGTNATYHIFGGEVSNNDLNFFAPGGGALTVEGVRTETSKKSFFETTGSTPTLVTFTNYLLASTFWNANPGQPRPATNATNTDTTHITLSVANSVTFGDYITIAGAGVAGALLHTHISSLADPTHATLDGTPISTNVVNAAVNLDTTVEQNQFTTQAGGPFVMNGGLFLSANAENAFNNGNGTIVLNGIGFAENFANPNPLNSNNPFITSIGRVTWSGIWYNNNPATLMPDQQNSNRLQNTFFNNLPASGPFATAGMMMYCLNCKNVQDDGATFDSNAVTGGNGTTVLYENGHWRVH